MGYLKPLAALALALALGAASDVDPVMVEAGIAAQYDAQCAALQAGDVDAWARTLAPDFLPTMPGGKTGSFATARDGVAALLASTKIERCRIVPEEIRMDGSDAVVAVGVSMSGTQKNGKPVTVEQHAVDRWSMASGTWLQKSSTVSEQTVR